MNAKEIIELLGLVPLSREGGFYRETYRAHGVIVERARNYSTAIFYLVTPQDFSVLHRIPHDEIFHFYLGDPIEMLQIDPQGSRKRVIMGPDIKGGHQLQVVVGGDTWQGERLVEGGSWALLGTTVAPGFDARDLEIGDRDLLLEQFPQWREDILEFTR